jgi:hypothetical protein
MTALPAWTGLGAADLAGVRDARLHHSDAHDPDHEGDRHEQDQHGTSI